jgi:hypothetical protein
VPYVSSGTWATETALDETRGGTGQTTISTGDILYGSASNVLSKLAAGSDGDVLTLASGVPSWGSASAASEVHSMTGGPSSGNAGEPVRLSAANTVDSAANSSEAASKVMGFYNEAYSGGAVTVEVITSGMRSLQIAATAGAIAVGDILYLKNGNLTTISDITLGTDWVVPCAVANATLSAGGGTVNAFFGAAMAAIVGTTTP